MGLGLRRAALDQLLMQRAAELGATTHLGCRIEKLSRIAQGWQLEIRRRKLASKSFDRRRRAQLLGGAAARPESKRRHAGTLGRLSEPFALRGRGRRPDRDSSLSRRLRRCGRPRRWHDHSRDGDRQTQAGPRARRRLPVQQGAWRRIPISKKSSIAAIALPNCAPCIPFIFRRDVVSPTARCSSATRRGCRSRSPAKGFISPCAAVYWRRRVSTSPCGGEISPRRGLAGYERACRRAFRSRLALNALMRFAVYRPALIDPFIRLSAKNGRLLNSLVDAVCVP